MSTIRTLSFKTAVDQSGFDSAIRSLAGRADDFGQQIGAKLANLKVAMPEVEAPRGEGPGAGAAGQADQLATSLLPLAGKIQGSITQAMAPLNAFAARFAGQFDQVGSTIIQISKRIDSQIKFPVFQKGMEAVKVQARATFVDAEGSATRFGATLDKVITGVQAASKVKQFVGSIGGLKSNLGALKAPNINFDNSIRSVVNLKNVTNQAASTFKGLAGEVALALGAFGLVFKAVGFLKDGISSASDLNETISKTDAVLGSASGSVKAFADDMAAKFGLVKGETLDVASAIGGLGKGLGGLEGADLSKFTTDFTKLAADLSSFKNISLADAGKALQVGLSGEQSDQLKALGVVMTEDTVKSYAYANGIGKVGVELTEQQKVMARSGLIQAGLADASGDLEKTQDGTANQFRKFTGTITNLGTSIGTMLLPALTKGLGVLNTFATTAAGAFASARGTFEGFVSAISTGIDVAVSIFNNWGTAVKVVQLVVAEKLSQILDIFAVIGPNAAIVAKYIGDNWTRILSDAFNWTLGALKNIGKNFEALGTAIGKFLADPTSGFKVDWTPLSDGFKATVDKFPDLIKPNLTDMSKKIKETAQPILDDIQRKADDAKAKADKAKADAKGGAGGAKPAAKPEVSKELLSFAKELVEKVKTPFEKYNDAATKVDDALKAGLITKDQAGKGKVAAFNEHLSDLAKPKFAGAVEAGSKEGYSAILAATQGRGVDLKQVAERQLAAQLETNRILGKPAPPVKDEINRFI